MAIGSKKKKKKKEIEIGDFVRETRFLKRKKKVWRSVDDPTG